MTNKAKHYVIASQSQRRLQNKVSLSLRGGVIQFPGVPVMHLDKKLSDAAVAYGPSIRKVPFTNLL